MSKIAFIAVLGLAVGWICVGQFERVQLDIAVASVDRNIAHATFTLPNLKTSVPAIDMFTAAVDPAQQHARLAR
jgi:hypothetical protein